MFYFSKIDGKSVLKSDMIKAEHFFTTRESIIKSKEPDFGEIVKANKQRICEYLGIANDRLISPKQTHTSNVEVVSESKKEYPDTDALIAASPDVAIFLNFADCTPLIFYDEDKNIGAVSHAGWRGTAANIATNTINKMISLYGSDPKNITAAIGPAIGFCCYNVGEEVYTKLKSTVKDFEGLSEVRNGEIFVDLKRINARQIAECGVNKIDIAPYCTCCNNDMFFSYRKENGTTNRHSAVLKIN